ncbi:MAG: glycoside hydrolase family 10 protein [Gemmiger sp.]
MGIWGRRPAAGLLAALALAALCAGCSAGPAASGTPDLPAPTPQSQAPLAYRAVWISYLEWQRVDFSSAAAFCADVDAMLDNCAALGLNTVIAQVRPFADALYPSSLFPFSHLCTGTQGGDPGFDPLALLVAAAHARGLRLEAWVNPYRIAASSASPGTLCSGNLAYTHPDWVKSVDGGLYLDPACTAAQRYIADGLAELCENYDIDGIQFDDYFYPTTDPAFDAAEFAASGAGDLGDWRRGNVNDLICLCYRTVHRYPGVTFGVAPLGSPQANRESQYSDAALWLSTPGYVDYLAPQTYWGLDYTKDGSDALSLGRLARSWLDLPRADGVRLHFGLAACRIGEGDGSDAGAGEWTGGSALAGQAARLLAEGADGFVLYRYDSLFAYAPWPELAQQEVKNLSTLIFHL